MSKKPEKKSPKSAGGRGRYTPEFRQEALLLAVRVGASHRYITRVPNHRLASADFLRYYLLTEEGLGKIGNASPDTADRNRTLSVSNLMAIEVSTPPLAAQQTFDRLQAEIVALKAKHTAIREANAALLPATLERLFADGNAR